MADEEVDFKKPKDKTKTTIKKKIRLNETNTQTHAYTDKCNNNVTLKEL